MTAPTHTDPSNRSPPSDHGSIWRIASTVRSCASRRRSHAPVCTSAKSRNGAMTGFDTLAAAYIFKRLRCSTRPTMIVNSR